MASNRAAPPPLFRYPSSSPTILSTSPVSNSILHHTMKRDHHLLRSHSSDPYLRNMEKGNEQQWCKTNQNDNDLDELLAVLGYKVKTSDMAEVAQKLEKLEEVIDSAQEQSLTHLTYDTVHYNPSDIQSWIDTMISELNDDCDLKAIPGKAIFAGSKRLKPDPPAEQVHPLLLEENGIRLVHSLTACADAVHQENFDFAAILVKQIGILAATQVGAMGKVAIFFAEALARRIYGVYPQKPLDFSSVLEMYFYDASPCLKFAHFTANQAILESFEGKSAVHVVDFSMNEGIQWPALMQALSIRPGGAPSFRVTSIGITEPNRDVGIRLGQFAETVKIDFGYRGIRVCKWEEMNAEFIGIRSDEAVAVNSVFELHTLLAGLGSLEKFLTEVKKMKPAIFTVVEQEASHNSPVFLDRFMESLHYYSTLFDSLEGCESTESASGNTTSHDRAMAEVYLGQQICNIVACDGDDRVERHEPLARWRSRFGSAGFIPVHLGSDAFTQASMLLGVFEGREGYRVEEDEGCLMLAWHTRSLIATSAWRPVQMD